MKHNETPEMVLSQVYNSEKIKKLAIILVTLGIIICIVPLLPPIQNVLISFLTERYRGTSGELENKLRLLLSLPFFGLVVLVMTLCCIFSKTIAAFLENAKNTRLVVVLTAGILTLLLCFMSVFSYQHGWQWLNSDHSSEMVLGKLLADENTFVSRNWHYSSEIRLIYQTIFTMPLFKFLGHYENWALIRSLNIFFNNMVLILSYLFMARQMKIQLKWICITGIFLLMPISAEYWDIVTFGGYYIFFIAQLFCGLGLFIRLVNHTDTASTVLPGFILFTVLSFVLGVQGIRALLCIHIPLFMTCVYFYATGNVKKSLPLFLGCYGFVVSCIGYTVNSLLYFWYSFNWYGGMRLTDLEVEFLPKLGQSLVCLAEFFGISTGSSLLSAQGLFSVAAIAGTFILFWAVFKSFRQPQFKDDITGKLVGYQFMPVFFIVSAVINICVFIVVNEVIIGRYFIPFMVLYVPLIAILFEYAEKEYSYLKRMAIIAGIILFIFGQGYLNFQSTARQNVNAIRKGYIQYLLENKLEYGFATFWNANVTTELSNGKIKLSGLKPSELDDTKLDLYVHNWLTMKKYSEPLWYQGESFLLLTRTEWELAQVTGRSFTQLQPDYEDRGFIIIRYPSAEAIHREVLDS